MIEQIKGKIKVLLEEYYLKEYNLELSIAVEEPKKQGLGDISVPVFAAVKALKKPLPECVNEVVEIIKNNIKEVEMINPTGGFVNILLNKQLLSEQIIKEVVSQGSNYGNRHFGEGKTCVLDYSSPNIAKSFSIGHLRSTMIGNSLKLIHEKCGYKTVGINYLGDWGTQFGKMIVAYELWGDKDIIDKDPINELTKLYVRFTNESKLDPSLDDKARYAFRQVELGDEKYLSLWKWIREESLKESKQIYDLLNISFDSYRGEAYYNDKMDAVVAELEAKQLLKEDNGAMIVDLGEDKVPALIKRADGGSLYITRDLAAIFDRMKDYNFDLALYVVGNEQRLHFEQLKSVLTLMGYDYGNRISHVNFGLVLQNGKKMSTRTGNVVKLYDVLEQAIKIAYEAIESKNPTLENKEDIARKVGVGAVVFNDLKNHRTLDVEFDLNQMVKFEGQTGPYLQYSSVRIASIINGQTFDVNNMNKEIMLKDHYFELVKSISQFGAVVERACVERLTSIIAKYLLSLAQLFNKFYAIERINVEDEQIRNTNFALASCVRTILNEGMRLLGIEYLDRM